MRVGFVTQWFPPEPGTAAPTAIADGLAARSHHVDVLTGFPNYPTGRVHQDFRLRPYQVEEAPWVTIHRCLLYPSHNRSAVERTLSYLSFAACAGWVARRKLPCPDVWLVYSSPATAALPALLTGRRRRAPVCLIIQDLWPDSVLDSGFLGDNVRRVAERVLRQYCDWTYARAAGIGIISPGMEAILGERGVETSKIFYTPNSSPPQAPNGSSNASVSRRDLGLPSGRLFMYAGNLGRLQGLELLVRAFSQVPQATLVLVGDGVERSSLVSQVQRGDIRNVHFVGAQPLSKMNAYIQASDIQVISLQDTPLLRATMPSKMQAALSSGKAIFAHAAGDVAELIVKGKCGWAAMPGNERQAVELIRTAHLTSDHELAVMGKRGQAYAAQSFSREVAVDRLEAMLFGALQRERQIIRG